MKLIVWRWLAVSSLLVAALSGWAETRPQYGGTLHVAMRAARASLDPADTSQADSATERSITLLMFEPLVAVDDGGRIRGVLATSWEASSGGARWQFHLRRGVRFHDGTTLTTEVAAASLRAANPAWKITAEGESVVIECESPDPELPAELALPRNAIAKRNTDRPVGTGPFHIVDWQPGKTLTLAAEEDYWRGRPFLDGIQIEMGKSFRDQLTALDLNRADLVEVAPEQAHRVSLEGRRLINSAPIELFALVFARDAQTPEEKSLREALALCVERASIRSVLLQGAGQATAGVLPYWMSGYDFVFSIDADLARARHAREQARSIPTLSLGYDAGDPTARLLTERIALNAKDAGLSVQPKSGDNADLRLMRIPLASADPWIALAEVDAISAAPALKNKGGTVEDLYAAEQTLLATQRIIPLFHLPVSYAASTAVKGWGLRPDGTLNLADAWLGSAKP
jgi:peptide/nickel transport system substrate-binding protein